MKPRIQRTGIVARLALGGALFGLAVSVARAAPFLEVGVLLPSVPERTLLLGQAVAVSGDVAVVGAPFKDRVFVYQRTPTGWGTMTEVAELTMSNVAAGSWAGFGSSLAIEGDTIVVGAPHWRPSSGAGAYAQGAVFVYQKPPGGWQNMTETARLTSGEPARQDLFGDAVAISGDTIAVGALSHDLGEPSINANYGAVYVFVRSGPNWVSSSTPTAKLVASDRVPGDELGAALGISATTIVAGAPRKKVGGEPVGTVYVFERPASGWTNGNEVAKLRPATPVPFERFGAALAIAGTTIVAGAPNRHDFSTRPPQYFKGGVYLFERPGTGWNGELTETAFLQVSDANDEDAVGSAVALWGNRVLAGMPYYGSAATGEARGAVAVFERPQGGWSGLVYESMKMTPSDATENDQFGEALATSGPLAAVAAPYRAQNGVEDVGRAYVFEEVVLCTPLPRPGCKSVTAGKGSPLLLLSKSRSGIRYDRVTFRWFPGEATDMSEFGDPTTDHTYALCVYDETPSGFSLIVDATAPPGGLCAGRPCWRTNRTGTKWLYRDRELSPDGMLRLDLVSGPSDKARLVAVAKGARAGVPLLPLQQATRVVAQVVNDAGACWGAEFTAPARVNSTRKFRDYD